MESWKDWFTKIFLMLKCEDWLTTRDPFITDLSICSLTNPCYLTLVSDYSIGLIESISLKSSSFQSSLPNVHILVLECFDFQSEFESKL